MDKQGLDPSVVAYSYVCLKPSHMLSPTTLPRYLHTNYIAGINAEDLCNMNETLELLELQNNRLSDSTLNETAFQCLLVLSEL